MNPAKCNICRKPLSYEDGTMLTAFGKPLFPVHRDPCAKITATGAELASRLALYGLGQLAMKKVPKLVELFRVVQRHQQLRG